MHIVTVGKINKCNKVTTRDRFGIYTLYSGMWDMAETLQVKVMHPRKVKLGSEHPDSLEVMGPWLNWP